MRYPCRWLMEAHPHKIAELEKGVADPLMACLLHGLQVSLNTKSVRA